MRELPEMMPISYFDDDGNPTGFETELLREIARRANLEIEDEFSPSFSIALDALREKDADIVISSVSITEERKEVYEFSTPYFIAHPVTIVTKDDSITSAADLADKTVAVLTDSTHEQIIKDIKGENADDGSVVAYDTTFLAVKAVARGEVDAAIGDDAYILSFSERYKDYGLLSVIDESYGDDRYGIALKKGETELKEKIDEAIRSMVEDGTYDSLFKKWYPSLSVPVLAAN